LFCLLEIPVRLLPELQEQRPRLLLTIAWATFATSSFQFLVCFLFSVVLFVLTRLFNINGLKMHQKQKKHQRLVEE
jgi:hypothetical protein